MREPTALPICSGNVAVLSARNPDKQGDNEDAAGLLEIDADRALLVVADGLGGHAAGADASNLAVASILDTVRSAEATTDGLRAAIMTGVERANEGIMAMGVGAATTVAIIELERRTIRPYHVGDSTIMVTGQRGRIRLQTVAHSPVGYAVESGLLAEHEAIHHADRHLISNMVGSPEMRIEVGSMMTLHRRDTLLLASDGLCDNLTTGEIVESIRKGPLTEAAARLLEQSGRRMARLDSGHPSKPDDLTFILYRPRA